jgi:hypothetical protein
MAAISQPQIIYNPGSGNVTLAFKRGPQNFLPAWSPRVHDNLSTSGAARERVVENLDILINFDMQHILVSDDMGGWESFLAFALAGGQFNFYPNAATTDYYHCVDESAKSELKYTGPGKYSKSFTFRIINDSQAPSDPGVILRRFYGITT